MPEKQALLLRAALGTRGCFFLAGLQLTTVRNIDFGDGDMPAARASASVGGAVKAAAPQTPAARDSAMLEAVKAAQYQSLVEHG